MGKRNRKGKRNSENEREQRQIYEDMFAFILSKMIPTLSISKCKTLTS